MSEWLMGLCRRYIGSSSKQRTIDTKDCVVGVYQRDRKDEIFTQNKT